MISSPLIKITLPLDFLVPMSKALLLAAFGFTLVLAMRGAGTLEAAFERLIVGLLALTFYRVAAATLSTFGDEIYESITHIGDGESLRALLIEAFKRSASAPTASGDATAINIPSLAAQAIRTGVWGVFTTAVEWIFMVSAFLLQAAQTVLWNLLLFLFPVSCGLYPVFPRMLANLSLHALELVLWLPILALIELVTAQTAKAFLTKEDSLGLYIVAIELVAVLLMLSVPAVTHRLLSGAFSGDFGSTNNVFDTVKRWTLRATAMRAIK